MENTIHIYKEVPRFSLEYVRQRVGKLVSYIKLDILDPLVEGSPRTSTYEEKLRDLFSYFTIDWRLNNRINFVADASRVFFYQSCIVLAIVLSRFSRALLK